MTDGWTGFTPILKVKDADASIRFYCGVLGFSLDWIHRFQDDFPAYACVRRGPLIAHLSEHEGGGTEKADLFIAVPNVDEVYAEFTRNGLNAEPPVSDPDIGLRHFEFDDPDGHHLGFGWALESTQSNPDA
ncbi:MAG: glyoxalase superfamily protein [Planctomycetota bacterium]|nr:glyoxalase superfamily protein [Planctomycetota bacterium]